MSVTKVTLADEFRRNSDLKQDEFEALKEWYSKQPHLPPISDEFLALFFHSCYYRMEPTKTTIDTYFTVRTHVPEFFKDRNPKIINMKNGKQVVRFFFLPSETAEGFRIICSSLGINDPSDFNFNEVVKAFLMTADLDHLYTGSSNGFIICVDMSNIQLGHIARFNLLSLKKVLFYLQEAMPIRLKGLHFINVVPFMDKILNMMRPFMKKELMDSIVLHTSLDSLYKIVPKEMLPTDWGGSAGSIDDIHGKLLKFRQENGKFFEEEAKLRVIEAKRPGKSKNAGDLFGIEGSFKKLDLD